MSLEELEKLYENYSTKEIEKILKFEHNSKLWLKHHTPIRSRLGGLYDHQKKKQINQNEVVN